MVVRVSRRHLRQFAKWAYKTYPREAMALLIGQKLGKNLIGVSYVSYLTPAYADRDRVVLKNQDLLLQYDLETGDGLYPVGTIHTHSDSAPIMSEGDRKSHIRWCELVSAVAALEPSGRFEVRFWQHDSPVPCDIEFFENSSKSKK